MRTLALIGSDGHVAVMRLVPQGDALTEAVATAKALRDFAAVSFEPIEVIEIDPDSVPTDRTYRDAWRISGGKFGHNMAKAKDIHRDQIREARKPMMAALDIEFTRAIESGSDTAPIAARKQALRDAPAHPDIEAAQTVEQLKAVWPLPKV